jgi:UDP-3-O-[3-hydroxymyristoyl] glucosamine N-acyltransferase
MRVDQISSFDSSFVLGSSVEKSKSCIIEGICDKRELKSNHLYFCSNSKFLEAFRNSKEKNVFIIFEEKFLNTLEERKEFEMALGWASVKSVALAMSYISKPFYDYIQSEFNDAIDARKTGTCSIHPSAVIAENVFIGANVTIGENVVLHANVSILSNSIIGKETCLYPNVSIMQKTEIGEACRIHSGTVIGSDGFGYNFHNGVHHKVWHTGGVHLGDNVEIGSNCSIDQGTFSPTIIESGCKIDNLVQVGHNVVLKSGVIFCGQAGIAGSTTVGEFTVVGGKAAIAPDIVVGAACQIGGMAGVTSSLENKEIVAGFPARPIKEWLKGLAYLRKNALKK